MFKFTHHQVCETSNILVGNLMKKIVKFCRSALWWVVRTGVLVALHYCVCVVWNGGAVVSTLHYDPSDPTSIPTHDQHER